MSDDKMRAEFEAWAKAVGFDLTQTKGDDRYWYVSTESAWEAWQAAYQAGRKAGREAMQREREEWSKSVHKRWIETRTLRGGE